MSMCASKWQFPGLVGTWPCADAPARNAGAVDAYNSRLPHYHLISSVCGAAGRASMPCSISSQNYGGTSGQDEPELSESMLTAMLLKE